MIDTVGQTQVQGQSQVQKDLATANKTPDDTAVQTATSQGVEAPEEKVTNSPSTIVELSGKTEPDAKIVYDGPVAQAAGTSGNIGKPPP